jgi:hypothetical protein
MSVQVRSHLLALLRSVSETREAPGTRNSHSLWRCLALSLAAIDTQYTSEFLNKEVSCVNAWQPGLNVRQLRRPNDVLLAASHALAAS